MSGKVGMRPGARVTVVCLGCERPFETLPSRLRLGRGLYCSLACSGAQRREADPQHQRTARLPAPSGPAVRIATIPANCRQVRLTGRCQFCGASAFGLEEPAVGLDRPHPAEVATVVCLLCTRRVLRLEIGGPS